MPNFQILLVTILIAIIKSDASKHNHTIYHLIPDYEIYRQAFYNKATSKNTIQMTQFGTGKQICNRGTYCRFFVYKYEPQNQEDIKNTILITSGMHGNQLLGPTTIFYVYQLLNPNHTRILYFPICNPSGYNRKQRDSYPNNIDLNRDYPIDQNTKCYEGSSTRIIDKLFRKYEIDLTINLHNGGDQIGWNWGTKYNQKFPKTDDEDVYASIGSMLKFYGGKNQKLGINQFKVGTMSDIVYPAVGTLDDWAYGGSWAQSAEYQCRDYKFEPYPKEMHKGLVFLIQLGQHNAPEKKLGTSQGLVQSSQSTSINNGYITRAIRMLKELVKVVDPVVKIDWVQQKILVKIQGCGTIDSFSLIKDNQDENTAQLATQPLKISTVQHSFYHVIEINLSSVISSKAKSENNTLSLSYKIECDKKWQQKGRTKFSRPRILTGSLKLYRKQKIEDPSFQRVNGQKISQNKLTFWLQIAIPIALFCYIVYRLLYKREQKKRDRQSSIFGRKNNQRTRNKAHNRNPDSAQLDNQMNQSTEGYIELQLESGDAESS